MMSDGMTAEERQIVYRVARENGLDIRPGTPLSKAFMQLCRALDEKNKELRRLTMPQLNSLADVESAILTYLAGDDSEAGEGRWYFRLEPNRTDAVAFPPRGTQRETLDRIITNALGGGHIDTLPVDRSGQAGKLKKQCIVVGIPYQEAGAQESRGERPTTPDAAEASADPRQPHPVPTGEPPPPPPPAQPGDGRQPAPVGTGTPAGGPPPFAPEEPSR